MRLTTGLTDDSGSLIDEFEYDVFGAIRSQTGSSANEFKFTGEPVDGSGLQFLRARYYDPVIGRFLARDPVPFLQRYAYAGNNPINFVDPFGLFPAAAAAAAPALGPALPALGAVALHAAVAAALVVLVDCIVEHITDSSLGICAAAREPLDALIQAELEAILLELQVAGNGAQTASQAISHVFSSSESDRSESGEADEPLSPADLKKVPQGIIEKMGKEVHEIKKGEPKHGKKIDLWYDPKTGQIYTVPDSGTGAEPTGRFIQQWE